MKKHFLFSFLFLITIALQAQNYFFEADAKDSTRWRTASVTQTQQGGLNYEYSPLYSRDTAVMVLVNIKASKLKYIEALNAELSRIDTVLKRATGKVYDDYVALAIANSLAGSWEYISGSDTLSLSVDNKLKISGGKVKGSIKVEKNSLVLIGLEKDPVILTQKDRIFINESRKIKFYKL